MVRLSDVGLVAPRIGRRAQKSRLAASLGRFPFKEEVMGSHPIRATGRDLLDSGAVLDRSREWTDAGTSFSSLRGFVMPVPRDTGGCVSRHGHDVLS